MTLVIHPAVHTRHQTVRAPCLSEHLDTVGTTMRGSSRRAPLVQQSVEARPCDRVTPQAVSILASHARPLAVATVGDDGRQLHSCMWNSTQQAVASSQGQFVRSQWHSRKMNMDWCRSLLIYCALSDRGII